VESRLAIMGHRLQGRMQLETHFGEPDQLECFPGLLSRPIMNLASNAIDAIDGHGRIDIRTGVADRSYQIVVTDSGKGIPPQLRECVLQPFLRLSRLLRELASARRSATRLFADMVAP
jgi:two-component system NtrC family sensor kinase